MKKEANRKLQKLREKKCESVGKIDQVYQISLKAPYS